MLPMMAPPTRTRPGGSNNSPVAMVAAPTSRLDLEVDGFDARAMALHETAPMMLVPGETEEATPARQSMSTGLEARPLARPLTMEAPLTVRGEPMVPGMMSLAMARVLKAEPPKRRLALPSL